jgi:mRNA interferase RelE/StbE
MHQVRLLQPAIRDLQRLDKSTAARVVQRIKWLAENIDSITPKRLTGPLAGLCKLREGDYRVIYQVLPAEKTIVVHSIGHRKDIYRKQ